MIPRKHLFPGVIIRVVKERRGTLGRLIYFWQWDFFENQRSAPLKVGETFEVLEHPRTVHNMTLVRVRRPGTMFTGDMRYGELHFHCEIVDDNRPKGRTLWDRLDDDSV